MAEKKRRRKKAIAKVREVNRTDKNIDRINKLSSASRNVSSAVTGGARNMAQARRYAALTRSVPYERINRGTRSGRDVIESASRIRRLF